jgi:hypothetical protein
MMMMMMMMLLESDDDDDDGAGDVDANDSADEMIVGKNVDNSDSMMVRATLISMCLQDMLLLTLCLKEVVHVYVLSLSADSVVYQCC